jgi:flagellar biosynthetic protein FliQ
MHEADAVAVAKHALVIALQITTPALAVLLVVGIVVSLFQAVTQIQEQTLTFLPKALAFVAVLMLLGPWMLHVMAGYAADTFNGLPGALR